MKTRILNLILAVFLLSVFSSCEEKDSKEEWTPVIASFYPSIIMSGTELTIIGDDLQDTRSITFPGGNTTTEFVVVNSQTLKVRVPENIGDEEDRLTITTSSGVLSSNQTIRKANPAFEYFNPAEEVATYENLSIIGSDFLLASSVKFAGKEKEMTVSAIDFLRKSNSEIKIKLPKETPSGDNISLKMIFENGEEMLLGELKVTEGEGNGSWVQSELVIFDDEPKEIGSWGNIVIPKERFVSAKVGDMIRVYISDVADPDSYPQGSLKAPTGNWDGLNEEMGCFEITALDKSSGYYERQIADEAILDLLSEYGLVVTGQNYTVTKVSLFTSVWIESDNDNSGSSTDPITEHTVMLNDFDPVGDHNCDWDHSWTDSEATEFPSDENGNIYLYLAKPLMDDSWLINCNHVDRGSVADIENYEIKLDIRIDEGAEGFSKAVIQFVIADNWCWVGDNVFPETTGGKWITIRFDAAQWLSGELNIGSITCGVFGNNIPAGISIDNFRLDPK